MSNLIINDNGVDREMTDKEQKQFLIGAELALKDEETKKIAIETKTVARQAVLDKLGLTADEAAALFG